MDVSTSLKRANLEDVWDYAQRTGVTLRVALRARESAALTVAGSGDLRSVSASGQMTVFGEGQQSSVVLRWRELIDLHDCIKEYLETCANAGLDPDDYELTGLPDPLPADVAEPAAVEDQTIFDWMMDRLVPVTEARGDYTHLRG